MAVIIGQGAGATSPSDLLNKLSTFLANNGWTISYDDVDGNGRRLHVCHPSELGFRVNFRSFEDDTVDAAQYDLTHASVYGIGVCGSTGHDPLKPWDEQPGYGGNGSIVSCGEPVLPIDPVSGLPIPLPTTSCGIPLPKENIGKYYFLISDSPLFLYIFVEAIAGSGIYQYINVGGMIKVGTWDGGFFVNASRSRRKMFTNTDNTTKWDVWDAGNDRPFKESQYANLFVYAAIDATHGWLSNAVDQTSQVACGTGRKCSGIVDPGASTVPSYKFLLGHGSMMTVPYTTPVEKNMEVDNDGALCNEFNSTSILFPFYTYALRDPMVWNKLSVIGYPPNSYLANLKYLAPGGTYELDHSGQHYMVFPVSKKGYLFGYDGFAIKVD